MARAKEYETRVVDESHTVLLYGGEYVGRVTIDEGGLVWVEGNAKGRPEMKHPPMQAPSVAEALEKLQADHERAQVGQP